MKEKKKHFWGLYLVTMPAEVGYSFARETKTLGPPSLARQG